MSKRILFISTPIGPLGSGHGGGVESTVINLLPILAKRGFKVGLIAPGPIITNVPFVKTIEVMGEPAVSALSAGRNSEVIVNPKGVLEKMWYTASCLQEDYDLVVSLSYDWLSFYLTPFFKIPVMHFITISSHIQAVDKMIEIVYKAYPHNFGLHTKAQAKTFGFFKEDICLLPSAVNLNIFKFYPKGGESLAWAGRISKEKGLEDAFKVANILNLPLNICGLLEDKKYWNTTIKKYKKVKYIYHGFVSQSKLNKILGQSKVFLATHKIVEAFGNTSLEALASGTPVISYNLGGPAEVIEEGKSGYLIKPGQAAEIAKAVKKIDGLDRKQARLRAEQYSYEKMAGKYENWVNKSLKNK